mmetsp:Transcript_39503/g.58665  ORF Transcript_39503/g.58665 Transcript_39503/m.58665 type:complete len:92 (+) Transcript_39503:2314-2589(+)
MSTRFEVSKPSRNPFSPRELANKSSAQLLRRRLVNLPVSQAQAKQAYGTGQDDQQHTSVDGMIRKVAICPHEPPPTRPSSHKQKVLKQVLL